MGALREKMIAEMKATQLLAENTEVLRCGDGGAGKVLPSVTGSTQSGTDPGLSVAFERTGFVAKLAQRGDLGDEVFLPTVFGVDRKAVIPTAEKTELAIARGVKPEGSRAIAVAAATQRDRCLLMTAYATGLRVSELVRLKVSAIDSHRMMVRVEQGKGRKDRYTILSQRLLCELRSYWKEILADLFVSLRKGTAISIDYVQKIYNRAKHKSWR